MKRIFAVLSAFFLLSFILSSCQPLTSLHIETLVPAKIEFPGNFNKLIYINLDTDINNDNETDTILYKIITNEMNSGFIEAINTSTGIDTANYLYVKGFPKREKFYKLDTISWNYLEKMAGNSNADIFIVLDSINLTMNNESYTDYYTYPTEYYKYREISVNIFWSVFDLVERKRLDQYHYNDTLFWEAIGYSKTQAEKELPSMERSIRELSFFAALDYGDRILPGWQRETRYYFNSGNKDFKNAALLVKDDKWNEASVIWEKYVNSIDREIASRACYNLALANEIMGEFSIALTWAKKSNNIKNKTKTRYYISLLKTRKKNIEKLQKQIY